MHFSFSLNVHFHVIFFSLSVPRLLLCFVIGTRHRACPRWITLFRFLKQLVPSSCWKWFFLGDLPTGKNSVRRATPPDEWNWRSYRHLWVKFPTQKMESFPGVPSEVDPEKSRSQQVDTMFHINSTLHFNPPCNVRNFFGGKSHKPFDTFFFTNDLMY